uniref:Uncharacterized protein n=1 Tax=Arion vulgaris TaxID=1028688 RepID=A0A0B7BDB7_9EUPU
MTKAADKACQEKAATHPHQENLWSLYMINQKTPIALDRVLRIYLIKLEIISCIH